MDSKIKAITCGIIFHWNNHILLCKPTMGKYWDIPKGIKEEGETEEQALIREVKEETGISLGHNGLEFFGLLKYRPEKNLALFFKNLPDALPITSMFCDSTVRLKNGKIIPEVSDYKWVLWKDIHEYIGPSLFNIFKHIQL